MSKFTDGRQAELIAALRGDPKWEAMKKHLSGIERNKIEEWLSGGNSEACKASALAIREIIALPDNAAKETAATSHSKEHLR